MYALVFCAAAPVLVFYTAGYRYNPKKSVIEHNGSLIADSSPKGARIFLDGVDTKELTPATIQNIPPGLHRVRYERVAYAPWEKSLEVTAEQVTFADQISLWRLQPTISRVREGVFSHLSLSDAGNLLAMSQTATTASTTVLFLDDTLQTVGSTTIPQVVSRLSWSSDGTDVLAEDPTRQASRLLSLKGTAIQTKVLPNASFTWVDQTLAGATSTVKGLQVQSTTGTRSQLLVDQLLTKKTYGLPAGQWTLAMVRKPELLLRDGSRWLGLSLKEGSQPAQIVNGDYPRWFTVEKEQQGLWIQNSELILWNISATPKLLTRQSQPIVQAAWHRSGKFVFFATATNIYALELDGRGGQMTTLLTSFDEIHDFTILGASILVAGRRDGVEGLWRVNVE